VVRGETLARLTRGRYPRQARRIAANVVEPPDLLIEILTLLQQRPLRR
jgi:hypothetical protein